MEKILSKLKIQDFTAIIDNKQVSLYRLKNKAGMEITVTNFGARITELFAPDKDGNFADLVLGRNTLDKYVNYKGARFFGAAVGRVANRIANAKFELNGKVYNLPKNNGENSLHGGIYGYDRKVWDVISADEQEINFRLISPDGDEGYPAEVVIDMSYKLTDDNALVINYKATSDGDTPLNLTNHTFFNLGGHDSGCINHHIMTIYASKYTPVDSALIPTGEIADVENTPLDFRTPTAIGERLDSSHPQMKLGNGYDHNWLIDKTEPNALDLAAEVFDPISKRVMKVYTTQPAMQFFGGNFKTDEICKSGKAYDFRSSYALETQHSPDSVNQPNFPSIILKKGEEYNHTCIYAFSVK
ncbi:MAG: galactose mutarotase [Verrucomicrobiaceae bacterium]|nr:galactose mutarotase [Verrucomicrobiaceae bacterium]